MSFFAFLRDNSRWLAGGFLLTFFSSFGQTFFISLSAGSIRSEYGLSVGDFGMIYMLATLASALTLTQLGKIVDHFSVARVTVIIVPALSLAAIGMAYANSVFVLAAVIFALRLFGQGMMTHNALTAVGRWYSAQRGRAVSVVMVGHQSGEAVLPLIFVNVVAGVGWRNTWLFAAVILVAVALPLIYALMRIERVPSAKDLPEEAANIRSWTRSEVLRDPIFWFILVGVLAPAFIGTTIFFNQDYLVELRGWSKEALALSYTVMAVMTVCFALIGGFLVDRFSAVTLLPFFFAPMALACFTLASVPQQWGIYLFMALMGVSYGLSTTLFGSIWPEIYGTRHLGSVRSVVVAFMVFGTALGPGVTGLLVDYGVAYPAQVFAMGVYCVLAGLFMFVVRRMVKARNAALPVG